MSKSYSQSAEKWPAFVRHFSGRTFYVNAVVKIMGPQWTFESLVQEYFGVRDSRIKRIHPPTSVYNAENVTNPGLRMVSFFRNKNDFSGRRLILGRIKKQKSRIYRKNCSF